MAEFQDWVNLPVTMAVRNFLLKEIQEYNSISDVEIIQKNMNDTDLGDLESIGVQILMRAATMVGIQAFSDFDNLLESMVEAEIIKEVEDE